jgi:hypothetical protein
VSPAVKVACLANPNLRALRDEVHAALPLNLSNVMRYLVPFGVFAPWIVTQYMVPSLLAAVVTVAPGPGGHARPSL